MRLQLKTTTILYSIGAILLFLLGYWGIFLLCQGERQAWNGTDDFSAYLMLSSRLMMGLTCLQTIVFSLVFHSISAFRQVKQKKSGIVGYGNVINTYNWFLLFFSSINTLVLYFFTLQLWEGTFLATIPTYSALLYMKYLFLIVGLIWFSTTVILVRTNAEKLDYALTKNLMKQGKRVLLEIVRIGACIGIIVLFYLYFEPSGLIKSKDIGIFYLLFFVQWVGVIFAYNLPVMGYQAIRLKKESRVNFSSMLLQSGAVSLLFVMGYSLYQWDYQLSVFYANGEVFAFSSLEQLRQVAIHASILAVGLIGVTLIFVLRKKLGMKVKKV